MKDFSDMIVLQKLRFPDTLTELGPDVLSGCLFMDAELPASLRKLGARSFMCCFIQRLRIPDDMPPPRVSYEEPAGDEPFLFIQGRQFKESIIDTLIVPPGYPYRLLMPEALVRRVVCSDDL